MSTRSSESDRWIKNAVDVVRWLVIGAQLRETAANAEKRLKCEMSKWQQNVRSEHQVTHSSSSCLLYLNIIQFIVNTEDNLLE